MTIEFVTVLQETVRMMLVAPFVAVIVAGLLVGIWGYIS